MALCSGITIRTESEGKEWRGKMYCKCGNVAEVFHRGDWVCKECRKAGLLPRYEKAKRVREQKCQEGIDRYWAGYWELTLLGELREE